MSRNSLRIITELFSCKFLFMFSIILFQFRIWVSVIYVNVTSYSTANTNIYMYIIYIILYILYNILYIILYIYYIYIYIYIYICPLFKKLHWLLVRDDAVVIAKFLSVNKLETVWEMRAFARAYRILSESIESAYFWWIYFHVSPFSFKYKFS